MTPSKVLAHTQFPFRHLYLSIPTWNHSVTKTKKSYKITMPFSTCGSVLINFTSCSVMSNGSSLFSVVPFFNFTNPSIHKFFYKLTLLKQPGSSIVTILLLQTQSSKPYVQVYITSGWCTTQDLANKLELSRLYTLPILTVSVDLTHLTFSHNSINKHLSSFPDVLHKTSIIFETKLVSKVGWTRWKRRRQSEFHAFVQLKISTKYGLLLVLFRLFFQKSFFA